MTEPTAATPRQRARPLDPDERRASIVRAVVPLLLTHGEGVTTRQVAEAAGVAEGTIFRVFDDKRALFLAVAEHVLNPPEADAELVAALEGRTDLRERVEIVAERMVERSMHVMAVMGGLRRIMMELHASGPGEPGEDGEDGHDHRAGPPAFIRDAHTALLHRLTAVFEPHRDELSVPPEKAAVVLRSLVLGSRQMGLDPAQTLSAAEIATVLLDGVARPSTTTTGGAR